MSIPTRSMPWVHSAWLDTIGILLPPFFALSIVALWPFSRASGNELSPGLWLVLIVGIDVAHVYASLYRTYWDPLERRARESLFLAIPFGAWLSGTVIYSLSPGAFWTALAYLAVFHFVRQQYGFLRLYSREEEVLFGWLDSAAIYVATLYPLIHWHTRLPRDFHWFIEGDFLRLPTMIEPVGRGAYALILGAYFVKEIVISLRCGFVNFPKNAVMLGTVLSWYIGIVHFNADIAFTLTNVVAHGVPYLFLVWMTCRGRTRERWIFSPPAFPIFVGVLLLFAYMEEGLWATLIWREHLSLFFDGLGMEAITSSATRSWVIPLLAIPQATHYVLDGFIWRRSRATLGGADHDVNTLGVQALDIS